jgi:geranylgeranyl pyrophosphate synthase
MELGPQTEQGLGEVEDEIRRILRSEPKEVYGLLEEYVFRGGKRMRPALLLMCFNLMKGADRKNVVKIAALIELFHNFTLIHDDIEDGSQFRRGKPTLHISHGIPIALNSGDALYTIVWNSFLALDMEAQRKLAITIAAGKAFQKVVEGQGIELEWHRSGRLDISEGEYNVMARGKTGALVAASCACGALTAGADAALAEKFWELGESIGLAFQIQDDVLNVIGDFEKYSKEIGGDITEGKRSLMYIHAASVLDKKGRERLGKLLCSGTHEQKKIDEAIGIFRETGAIAYAQKCARAHADRAISLLRGLPEGREKALLESFCEYAIKRDK